MTLQRRALLQKLLIQFEPDGSYVAAEALFEEGAWDADLQDWVGSPQQNEYPMHTSLPEGAKMLNDVLGTATLKALVKAEEWKAAVQGAQDNVKAMEAAVTRANRVATDKEQEALSWKSAYENSATLAQNRLEKIDTADSAARMWKAARDASNVELAQARSWKARLTFGLWLPKVRA